MGNLIKSEYLKFKSSYALWIIIGVVTLSACISVFTGTYGSAEQTLMNIEKDCMVVILASAIYGAVILSEDFSNGLVRCYISAGYKKYFILTAKLIHYISGCVILLFLYPFVSVLIALAVQGTETTVSSVLITLFSAFFKTLPLYLGIFGIFFVIAFCIKKGVYVAGTSVAVSILSVVFTNKLYYGNISILEYSPIIQIEKAFDITVPFSYCISVFVSVITFILCIAISLKNFKDYDIL